MHALFTLTATRKIAGGAGISRTLEYNPSVVVYCLSFDLLSLSHSDLDSNPTLKPVNWSRYQSADMLFMADVNLSA